MVILVLVCMIKEILVDLGYMLYIMHAILNINLNFLMFTTFKETFFLTREKCRFEYVLTINGLNRCGGWLQTTEIHGFT